MSRKTLAGTSSNRVFPTLSKDASGWGASSIRGTLYDIRLSGNIWVGIGVPLRVGDILRRNYLAMVILVMLFSLLGVSNAKGSYVSFSMDELIKQSDIILIGDIVGPVGERKDWSQGVKGTWSTYWKVNVYYYMKGDENAQEFIVSTPGAENKMVMTSIDYRLDQWGKTVLLFLKRRESGFEPFSPQGVVSLEKANSNQGPADTIDGKQILKEFTIVNPQINDPKALEKYILNNKSVLIPKPGTGGSDLSQSRYNPIVLTLVVTISLALLFLIIWLVKRHRNNK